MDFAGSQFEVDTVVRDHARKLLDDPSHLHGDLRRHRHPSRQMSHIRSGVLEPGKKREKKRGWVE